MNDQILKLELQLLILRYSRRRIIDSLASLGDQSIEEVERELTLAFERKTRSRSPARHRSTLDLIADVTKDRPETADSISTLVTRFENRSFLPHLREVVRFLDRAGISHGKLKSRRASTPKVIAALASLNAEELRALAAPQVTEGESDFALLAREIMAGGRPRRPAKEKT